MRQKSEKKKEKEIMTNKKRNDKKEDGKNARTKQRAKKEKTVDNFNELSTVSKSIIDLQRLFTEQ